MNDALIRAQFHQEIAGNGSNGDIDISQFSALCSDGTMDFNGFTTGNVNVLVSNGGTLSACPDESNADTGNLTPLNGKLFIPSTAFLFQRIVIRCANTVPTTQKVFFAGRG